MKKLLFILFCLIPTICFPAELLVRAKPHWMDSFTQAEVDKMSVSEKQSYEARSQIGDIIVIRPDGWQWGKEECLPNFIVVKIPQITEAEAKKYEESLIDNKDLENIILIRHRKYALPKTDIETAKINNLNSISFTKSILTNKVITKTGAESEMVAPKKDLISYLRYRIRNIAKVFRIRPAQAAQFLYKTIKPSGGDYTVLETCMNANEQDLTGDGWFDVEIDGTWSSADTSAVTIHNYTTTAADYINIYTTATARHQGVYSTSYYILNLGQGGTAFTISNSNITIDGLQIWAGSSSAYGINYGTQAFVGTVSHCIFSQTNGNRGISGNFSNGSAFKIYNNIFYHWHEYGIRAGGGGGATSALYIYNNTFLNCTTGISIAVGVAVLKNNLVNDNTTDYGGTFSALSTSNVTNDTPASVHCQGVTADSGTTDDAAANKLKDSDQNFLTTVKIGMIIKNTKDTTYTYVTAVDSDGILSVNDDIFANAETYTIYMNMFGSAVFINETEGSENLHLDSTDTVAIDKGVNLSTDPDGYLSFTDDIDTITRVAPWDIGADEIVTAAAARRNWIMD